MTINPIPENANEPKFEKEIVTDPDDESHIVWP